MPANVTVIYPALGLLDACLATTHRFPVAGAAPRWEGVLTHFALKTLPQSRTLGDWVERIVDEAHRLPETRRLLPPLRVFPSHATADPPP